MKVKDYEFSDDEIRILGQYRDKQTNQRLKTRFVALLILSQGISPETVASIIGNSIHTIGYWF